MRKSKLTRRGPAGKISNMTSVPLPNPHSTTSRRQFIKSAGLTSAALALSGTHGQAAQSRAATVTKTSADGRRFAVIGCGGNGSGHMKRIRDVGHVVALCDVDEQRLYRARELCPGASLATDFRRVLERSDVDAVVCSTVDHWHAMVSIAAMRAGKDVYCEKPLTLTFDEGPRIIAVRRKTGRILQVGTQQRSDERFRHAVDIARSGLLGILRKVDVVIPEGPRTFPFSASVPPPGFHFDFWKGPTPNVDYVRERTHTTFRYWYEYSGGTMTDWGAHHMDIAVWGADLGDTWPVAIRAQLLAPAMPGSYSTPSRFQVDYEYAGGLTVSFRSTPDSSFYGAPLREKGDLHAVRFTGDNGWVWVTRGGWKASDPDLLNAPLPADYTPVYKSDNHLGNFVACMESRADPICPPEAGHRSAATCHLGVIALRLGRDLLRFDPTTERFVDDDKANSLLTRKRRGPYDWSFIGEKA